MSDISDSFADHLKSGRVIGFAHRGAALEHTENSMAAFASAFELGFRFLETDIRASRDGTPWVFHDETLLRLADDPRRMRELSDRDLASIRVRGGHAILRLSELFEAFPDACFNLDIKSDLAIEPMAWVISAHRMQRRVLIGSFSDKRISMLNRLLGGNICRGVGTGNALRFHIGARLRLPQFFGAHAVQLPISHKGIRLITPVSISYAHRLGLRVHVWTINHAPVMHALFDMGVDGIMSDDPALLKQVMQERGIW